MVRIPACCNFDPETTVLAHINLPGLTGMGTKSNDLQAAWVCSKCHDLIDGRTHLPIFSATEIRLMFLEGVMRTQYQLWKEGKVSW